MQMPPAIGVRGNRWESSEIVTLKSRNQSDLIISLFVCLAEGFHGKAPRLASKWFSRDTSTSLSTNSTSQVTSASACVIIWRRHTMSITWRVKDVSWPSRSQSFGKVESPSTSQRDFTTSGTSWDRTKTTKMSITMFTPTSSPNSPSSSARKFPFLIAAANNGLRLRNYTFKDTKKPIFLTS